MANLLLLNDRQGDVIAINLDRLVSIEQGEFPDQSIIWLDSQERDYFEVSVPIRVLAKIIDAEARDFTNSPANS